MYHYHHRLLFMVTRLLVLHGSGFVVHKTIDCAAFVPRTTTFPHATRILNTGRTLPLYKTKGASATTQQQRQQQEEQEIFTSASFTTTTTATSAATIVTVPPSVDYQDNMMDDASLLLPSTSTTTRAIRSSSRWNVDDRPGTSQEREDDRRTVLVLLWFIAAISAMDRVAMSVALVPMSYEYSSIITDTTKGMISSLFSIGYGLAILPAGLLISCTSPKTLMTFGIFIWSIATIATPISAEWIVLTTVPILCVRSIVGMGEAVLIPTVHRLLSVWTTSEQKSSALAFIFSGFHAGTIGAYLLSPYIMDVMTIDNDWRVLFYVYGTFGILLLIPWLLFAKDQPSTPVTVSASATNNDSDTTVAVSTSWDEALESYRNAPWKEFIQSKGVWGMLLAHCAKNWGLYTSLSWTPTFYAEQYNIGVRDSAWLSVMPSIAGALGGFIAGTLADKTIKNMSLSLNDDTTTQIRKMFQTVGLLGPAFALAALAYQLPEEAWVAQLYLMVAVGLQSFNAGGFEAGTQDKAGPRWIGMLYSVTSLPSVMVGTFGVYATGLVLDMSQQDWSIVWYMNAAVNVLGALAFIGLYDSKREFE